MASRDAFEKDGQNHHTGNRKHDQITRWFSKIPQGHNNSSNIYVDATEYLNRPISELNLAQKDNGNWEGGFANASDYLETWDDSDSITVVNAQKDLRHPAKQWHDHSASQYPGSEASYEHTEVVESELRLESINPIRLWISNT